MRGTQDGMEDTALVLPLRIYKLDCVAIDPFPPIALRYPNPRNARLPSRWYQTCRTSNVLPLPLSFFPG